MHTIEDMKTFAFPVIIEKDEDGFYAECPILEGGYSQGDTHEEALVNIKEAISLVLEVMEANHEKIPVSSYSIPGAEIVEITI